MPARPTWFHRLSAAAAYVAELPTDWVDRAAVEEAFGVSKTVAWRILRRCGATEGPGNTLIARRDDFLAALARLAEEPDFQQELRRRAAVEDRLARLAKAAAAANVRVVPDERALEIVNSRFKHLPAGVQLVPGRLIVEFSGTEDFLEKVGAFVFALQNDFAAVRDFLEGQSS